MFFFLVYKTIFMCKINIGPKLNKNYIRLKWENIDSSLIPLEIYQETFLDKI